MTPRAHAARGPVLASLVVHGVAALAVAAAVGSGALGRRLPERVEVALAREVEAEPEPPPPPEVPPPEVREPDEVRLDETAPPDEEDPREYAPSDGSRNEAWETRGGVVGIGAGRAPGLRRPGRAPAVPAPVGEAAAEPEAVPPPPAEPPVRARLLPGECRGPVYPAREERMGVEGVVTLLVSIDADGRVGDVVVESSSGSDRLDAAALAAVRRWRFSPAMRDGLPVPDAVLQTVRFRIDRRLAAREER